MTRTFFAISLLFVLFLTGCASFKNDVAAGDSIFGSYKGDYVVVNATGGVIADVWVLRDVFCESEDSSDGWRFIDDDGNCTFLGGDVKVMRIKTKSILNQYHEYHMEFETVPYQVKFNRNDVAGRYHLRGRADGLFSRRVC